MYEEALARGDAEEVHLSIIDAVELLVDPAGGGETARFPRRESWEGGWRRVEERQVVEEKGRYRVEVWRRREGEGKSE